LASNPQTIVVDSQLAASERTAAQQVPVHLSSVVNGLSSLLAQRRPSSGPAPGSAIGPSTAALLTEIFQTAGRALAASSSSKSSEQAKEAAEKAKTWSIIGAVFAVVVAVVLVVVAIVVTVFTFGAAAPAAVAGSFIGVSLSSAVGAIANLMTVADQKGHPLAGRFAAAVSQIPRTLQEFTRANRYDTVALDAALRSILQSVSTIEGLGRESAQVTGRCTGDPDAVYQCAQQMGPLLSRLADILQTMRLLSNDQTQAAIVALHNATVVLTKPRLPK
jgi:hypothetical protein